MPKRIAPPVEDYSPWKAVNSEIDIAAAFQALQRGDATGDQQRRTLKFVITDLCRTHDLSFRPGPDGERATTFAEGKRFVGLQIVKLLNVSLEALRKGRGLPPGEQP